MHHDTQRMSPHSIEAERDILAAVFADPAVFDDVRALIGPDDFYADRHQRVFRAMGDLADDHKPIDAGLVYERLRRSGELADVGGKEYLAELIQGAATGAAAVHHAQIVRDYSLSRGLIHAANEILRDAYDRVQPAADQLAAAEARLFAVGEAALSRSGQVWSARRLMLDALARLDDRQARGGGLDGLSTGMRDLDDLLGGLRPGQLVVIGGRPGGGKTALGLTIAASAAKAGTPAFFASMEMPAQEIAERLLAASSGVGMHTLRRGGMSPADVAAVSRAADRIKGRPIFVDDTPDQPAARLAAVARRVRRRYGVGLVVVDYLQLMRPENPKENRTQQVGLCARRVKLLARQCGVPVLLLCQLNREVEGREGGKPRLSDLRESGEIEQHADAVILLSMDQRQDATRDVWEAAAVVAKNRNGPVGEAALHYRRRSARFVDSRPAP